MADEGKKNQTADHADMGAFFELSTQLMCTAQSGYFTTLNSRWPELLGYSKDELMSKPFIDFVHPEDQESTLVAAHSMFAGERAVNFENRYRHKNGHYIWLSWNARVANDVIYAAANDVTQYKQKEFYFEQLQESANIGYWEVDLSTMTPIWSDKTYDIHELPRGSKVDLSKAINFYAPDARPVITKLVEEAVATGKPYDEEFPFITAMGRRIWVRAIGLVEMYQGKAVRMYGTFQDVTDKKRAEIQAELILGATGDGFWDYQPESNYEYMSPRLWEMLGYDPEDKDHQPDSWKSLAMSEDLELAEDAYQKHVDSRGVHPYSQDLRFRHAEGRTVWVRRKGKVVEWDDQGRPLRMVGTHSDITDSMASQQHLAETTKLAALGQLAGGIAHEINNPLTVINFSAQHLMRMVARTGQPIDPKTIQEKCESITKFAKRIAEIVKSLRSVSRDTSLDEIEVIDVEEVVDIATQICTTQIQNAGIRLKVEIAEDTPRIHVRSGAIAQALLNLLANSKNAVEGTDGSWIRISTETHGSQVVISVIDSGPGIDIDIQDRLMEPFFTTKPVGDGAGLGLSVAKALIEDNNGQLRYNPSGANTRFDIILPKEVDLDSAVPESA